jgi:hypothetical protein
LGSMFRRFCPSRTLWAGCSREMGLKESLQRRSTLCSAQGSVREKSRNSGVSPTLLVSPSPSQVVLDGLHDLSQSEAAPFGLGGLTGVLRFSILKRYSTLSNTDRHDRVSTAFCITDTTSPRAPPITPFWVLLDGSSLGTSLLSQAHLRQLRPLLPALGEP